MSQKLFLVALGMLTSSAWANLHLAPPDFNSKDGKSVFVDFKTADYEVSYDLQRKVARVKSKITFSSRNEGKPIFDLVPNPSKVFLDGRAVLQKEISLPGGISKVRQLNEVVLPGEHTLEVESTITEDTRFSSLIGGVNSAFSILDLTDRNFLEQYLPTNLEYDQYKMRMDVKFSGPRRERQEIYTNGEVTAVSPYQFKIEFPEYFTSSCLYFQTVPKNYMKHLNFSYKSISGRDIPITVYSPWAGRNSKFKREIQKLMQEFETDYGPWVHPGFVAHGRFPLFTGGMEYAGATSTKLGALDHEMLHSYFAKGVMPANGNSGWIDEGIAAWRDKGYPRKSNPGFTGSDLGRGSPYQRHTDDRAYKLGSGFMAYLDWKLQGVGGLKTFLKGYFAAYKHTVITTKHFKSNLEAFSGQDFTADFATYIWGVNPPEK